MSLLCEDRWDAPCSGDVTHACDYATTIYVCERHAQWRLEHGHRARRIADSRVTDIETGAVVQLGSGGASRVLGKLRALGLAGTDLLVDALERTEPQ